MARQEEIQDEAAAGESEFDSNDAGWDPYVAALLSDGRQRRERAGDDEDADEPVMTISRRKA